MANKPPYIISIKFEDGTFDYIWCLIAMLDGDMITNQFEAYIAIGVDINIDTCSKEYLSFDESRVFCYAQDLDEFFSWYDNGGWDFKILDYESLEENSGG